MINNAFTILAFHNHPSGDPEASAEDIALTKRLKKVGEILNIKLIDHLIIAEGKWHRMKEAELI